MKLIDSEKVIKWLHEVVLSELPAKTEGYNRGKEHMVQMLTSLINSGAFDPTPPVQPDTEELSEEDIKELSEMLKNIESSCDSIAGHLKGMNNTLDQFGEVIK